MIKNEYFNTSNWTGRTPRTMEEAFGCYSTMNIEENNFKINKTQMLLFVFSIGYIGYLIWSFFFM